MGSFAPRAVLKATLCSDTAGKKKGNWAIMWRYFKPPVLKRYVDISSSHYHSECRFWSRYFRLSLVKCSSWLFCQSSAVLFPHDKFLCWFLFFFVSFLIFVFFFLFFVFVIFVTSTSTEATYKMLTESEGIILVTYKMSDCSYLAVYTYSKLTQS